MILLLMINIPKERILNVKNKPKFDKEIELKNIEDLQKLIKVGNLVCLYKDEKEKVYFIQNFFYKEKK